MKKNLRIVSAAAAALLAVAPVAASAVNVNAEVTNLGAGSTQTTPQNDASKINVVVTLTKENGAKIAYGDKVEDAKSATVSATQNGKTLTVAKLAANAVHVYVGNNAAAPTSTDTFKTGVQYKVVIDGLKITGLTTSETGKYAATGKGVFSGTGLTDNDVKAGDLESGVQYTDYFNVFDSSNKTVPYFSNRKTGVQIKENGTVSGTVTNVSGNQPVDGASMQDILDAAKATVVAHKTDATSGDGIVTTADDVKSQLQNQKLTVNADNKLAAGNDKTFDVTLTAQNIKSGKTSTVKVVFKTGHTDTNSDFPIIYYSTNGKFEGADAQPVALQQGTHNFQTPLVTIKAGSTFRPTDYFKAAINSEHALGSDKGAIWTNDFTVENNSVDTSKEGLYHVTVSAKNNAGKETKVTLPVAVLGNLDTKVAKIVNTPGYPVTVYNILDNETVKGDNNYVFLYNGDAVKTFETKTIDGKSYTRIQAMNSNASNEWVESDKLDNYKPATEESKSTRIMYKSAVYNKKMENTHETIYGYDYKDLVVDKDGNLKEFNLNGNKMYKIANKDQYVRVRNVTGSKMTLKHNAYVYKSNGKRANKKVYKKGQTITVYGGQYKAIKKYKGKAVRIGVNRYIKTANVNYKLY